MERNRMSVTFTFERDFDGVIYTKNSFKVDGCRKLARPSRFQRFDIQLDRCGMDEQTSVRYCQECSDVFTHTPISDNDHCAAKSYLDVSIFRIKVAFQCFYSLLLKTVERRQLYKTFLFFDW